MAFEFYASIGLDDTAALDGEYPLYVTTSQTDNWHTAVEAGNYPTTSLQYFRPVLKVGDIVHRFTSSRVAAEAPATMQITLVNKDGWLDQYLGFGANRKIWDGRTFTLKYQTSAGQAFASMTYEFVGIIKRGSLKHTQDEVSFDVYDWRSIYDNPVLHNPVTVDNWPYAEDKIKGKFEPIIFGDFTTDEGPLIPTDNSVPASTTTGGRLPAYCLDTTATSAYPFLVATHAVTDLAVRMWDDSLGYFITLTGGGTDYTDATPSAGKFTLSGARSADYDPTADFILVDCKGITATRTGSGLGGSAVLQNAPDIIYYMLTSIGGVASALIDTSSGGSGDFTVAYTECDQFSNRRYIGEQQGLFELIGEICWENNLYFYTSQSSSAPTNSVFSLKFNVPDGTTIRDVMAHQPVTESFEVMYDPDEQYSNVLVGKYSPNYVDPSSAWFGSVEVEDTDEQTNYGVDVRSDIEFRWLPTGTQVTLQLQRRLFVWGTRAQTINVSLADMPPTPSGFFWRLTLAQSIAMTYWIYDDEAVQILEIRRNGQTGRVSIKGIAVGDAYMLGRWDDTSPTVATPIVWNDSGGTLIPAGRWF